MALRESLGELFIIRPFIKSKSFNPRHKFPKESFNLFYKRSSYWLFSWREIVIKVLVELQILNHFGYWRLHFELLHHVKLFEYLLIFLWFVKLRRQTRKFTIIQEKQHKISQRYQIITPCRPLEFQLICAGKEHISLKSINCLKLRYMVTIIISKFISKAIINQSYLVGLLSRFWHHYILQFQIVVSPITGVNDLESTEQLDCYFYAYYVVKLFLIANELLKCLIIPFHYKVAHQLQVLIIVVCLNWIFLVVEDKHAEISHVRNAATFIWSI